MHVIFQFPIVDMRLLAAETKVRLPKPYWPSPDIPERRPFIRQFGRLRDRKLGGNKDWSAEEHFCDARLSIRYENLHQKGLPLAANSKSTIYKSYRRLYSDGKFMNKIELGFIDDLEDKLSLQGGKTDLLKVIRHYCDLPAIVDGKEIPLYKTGAPLAENYAIATTYRKRYNQEVRKQVIAGRLNITVVLPPGEAVAMPKEAELISSYATDNRYGYNYNLPSGGEEYLKLYGWNYQHAGKPVKIWIIVLPRPFDKIPGKSALAVTLRNLRINLLRIHAEKETIRIMLSQILRDEFPLAAGSAGALLVKSYLKNVAERLFALTRQNLQQQDILTFALHSEETALPGSIKTLEGIVLDFDDRYTTGVITGMAEQIEANKTTGILFLSASPTGKYLLDIQKELDGITNELERGKKRERYVFHDELGVRKEELLRFLNRCEPDILHISLHATKLDGLYFQDEGGEPAPLSVEDFAAVLKSYTGHRPLKAVIINACNSQAHAQAALPYCDIAMGTNYPVPDVAAAAYAKYFYQTLFDLDQADIQRCHDTAISQLEISGISVQDAKPVNEMFNLFKK